MLSVVTGGTVLNAFIEFLALCVSTYFTIKILFDGIPWLVNFLRDPKSRTLSLSPGAIMRYFRFRIILFRLTRVFRKHFIRLAEFEQTISRTSGARRSDISISVYFWDMDAILSVLRAGRLPSDVQAKMLEDLSGLVAEDADENKVKKRFVNGNFKRLDIREMALEWSRLITERDGVLNLNLSRVQWKLWAESQEARTFSFAETQTMTFSTARGGGYRVTDTGRTVSGGCRIVRIYAGPDLESAFSIPPIR